jgi:biopolymer transport protein ExbB
MVFDAIESFIIFIDRGGSVLWVIFGLAFLLWFLIIERFLYITIYSKKEFIKLTKEYREIFIKTPWKKQAIKRQFVSLYKTKLIKKIDIIKVIIKITPFLGLLGTVIGMIEVFDIVALIGNNNTKAMADGISKATISTLTSMIVSINGIIFIWYYENKLWRYIMNFKEML